MTTPFKNETSVVRDWRSRGAVRAVAQLRGLDHHQAARQVYPDDAETALKAATSPASTGGWGQQLSQIRVEAAAFLAALRPTSAAATLLAKALQVDLSGVAAVNLPRRASDWPAPAWIAEGAPIPIPQGSLTFDTLDPVRKLMAIAVLTMELSELSGVAAETIIGDLMLDAAGRALDASLFSTTAADTTRPAGLLNGVTATTAAGASGTLQDRALADVSALTTAIAAGGGGGSIALFASTAQATTLQAVSSLSVTPAPSLAAGTIVAVDTGAIAWAGNLPPEIETAKSAAVHMEDTSPAAIATAGTPNVVAAPVRSLFQTASHALRLRLPITWSKRSATAVQYVTGANW